MRTDEILAVLPPPATAAVSGGVELPATTVAREGFTFLPQLLSATECRQFLAAVREEARPPADWFKGHAVTSRWFHRLGTHPALLDAVSAVLGPDVILWGASLVTRRPGDRHPWHTDIESSRPAGGMVSVWVGLEGTCAATSLSLVAGSHRFGVSIQEMAAREGVGRDDCDDRRVGAWAAAHAPAAEVSLVVLGDGDALLFDGRLWHGSHNRDGERVRTAALLQYAASAVAVRCPDFNQLGWPFRWLKAPRPPCIVVRGDGSPARNRLVPPPPSSGAGHLTALTTRIQSFPLPFDPRPQPWRPHHLLAGSLGDGLSLYCHVSGLLPGCSPHPPHRHPEEEILWMLDGEADLVLPELPAPDGGNRHRLRAGQLVYYPADHPHTLEAVGERAATYLMLKWTGRWQPGPGELAAGIYECWPESSAAADRPFVAAPVLEAPTGWLARLHAHRSTCQPGAGYDPHVDAHHVVIVTLEGEIETGGERVPAHHVLVHSAGEPHGLRCVSSEPARYLVFELHPRGGLEPLVEAPLGAVPLPVPELAVAIGDEAAASPVAVERGPRPLPVRTALMVLAHALVYRLRGFGRRHRREES